MPNFCSGSGNRISSEAEFSAECGKCLWFSTCPEAAFLRELIACRIPALFAQCWRRQSRQSLKLYIMFESLQLWLASIKCTDLLAPLDGYGVDSVEDLKMLKDKHISELCFETPQDCLEVAINPLMPGQVRDSQVMYVSKIV